MRQSPTRRLTAMAAVPAPPMTTGEARHEVTQLLAAASDGDSHAAAELLPLIYSELQRLARSFMAKEHGGGAGQTLQPTALVHEAYLRLIGQADMHWDSRGHFFVAAATAMRRILVERARARGRIKRGGDRKRQEMHDGAMAVEPPSGDLLALDEALKRLEASDERKARVVMLRHFAGLGVEETAAALNVSPATVKNDWAFARAWLHREISKGETEA
jgi:RNA polymerase sigma factor (TIGR02999 family)